MGFRLVETHANLDFEGTQLEGAHIKARLDIPLDILLKLQESAESEDPKEIRWAFAAFGEKALLEWDLETEQGVPLPIGAEGMLALDIVAAQFVLQSWMKAVSAVSSPLVEQSKNGNMLEKELPEGMGRLSESLESLSTPNS